MPRRRRHAEAPRRPPRAPSPRRSTDARAPIPGASPIRVASAEARHSFGGLVGQRAKSEAETRGAQGGGRLERSRARHRERVEDAERLLGAAGALRRLGEDQRGILALRVEGERQAGFLERFGGASEPQQATRALAVHRLVRSVRRSRARERLLGALHAVGAHAAGRADAGPDLGVRTILGRRCLEGARRRGIVAAHLGLGALRVQRIRVFGDVAPLRRLPGLVDADDSLLAASGQHDDAGERDENARDLQRHAASSARRRAFSSGVPTVIRSRLARRPPREPKLFTRTPRLAS